MLREKISVKKSKVKTFEKEFIMLKRKLKETLGIIDYTHICFLFLNKNDRKLEHQLYIHSKNLLDLGFENSQTSHDPDKVIFNFSSHILSESEKAYFVKVRISLFHLKHWNMLIIYSLLNFFIVIYTA